MLVCVCVCVRMAFADRSIACERDRTLWAQSVEIINDIVTANDRFDWNYMYTATATVRLSSDEEYKHKFSNSFYRFYGCRVNATMCVCAIPRSMSCRKHVVASFPWICFSFLFRFCYLSPLSSSSSSEDVVDNDGRHCHILFIGVARGKTYVTRNCRFDKQRKTDANQLLKDETKRTNTARESIIFWLVFSWLLAQHIRTTQFYWRFGRFCEHIECPHGWMYVEEKIVSDNAVAVNALEKLRSLFVRVLPNIQIFTHNKFLQNTPKNAFFGRTKIVFTIPRRFKLTLSLTNLLQSLSGPLFAVAVAFCFALPFQFGCSAGWTVCSAHSLCVDITLPIKFNGNNMPSNFETKIFSKICKHKWPPVDTVCSPLLFWLLAFVSIQPSVPSQFLFYFFVFVILVAQALCITTKATHSWRKFMIRRADGSNNTNKKKCLLFAK